MEFRTHDFKQARSLPIRQEQRDLRTKRRILPRTSIKASARARLLLLKQSEAGFTLIEMLVSALLLVSIGAASAESLIATAYISGDQRRHSQAAQLAQDDQERLRGLSVAQLNSLNQASVRTATVGGTSFTVTSTSRFLNNTGGPSCIPGAAAYFQIVSAVDWAANKRGPVVTESIIAPPAGGTIRATVRDQTGTPLQGATVSASGPDVETAPTDTTGCAVLSGLATGTYNVTYAMANFVDPNGNDSPPNITATVTSTGNAQPSTDPISLGLAGTLSANFQAFVNTTQTDTGEADYLSWYGAGAAQSMTTSKYAPTTATGVFTTLASTRMYPFAFTGPSYVNNYQVWAGKCRQMQPPAGINQLSVAPGSTQANVLVKEPELDLFVTNGAGVRIKPSHVKMSFANTSGPNCTDAWQPTIDPTATTNTHGVLLNAGQPFATSTANLSASTYTGTISICVDNGSRSKTVTGVTDSYTAVTTVNIDLSSGTSNSTCP